MNKIFILGLFSFFYANLSVAQIYSDTTWERWYGTQNYDELTATTNHHIEHYDKGYIFHAYNGNTNEFKAILKKTDINGYLLWQRELDPSKEQYIVAVKNYEDGGIVICGGSYVTGICNPWVAKLNACMEVEWCKRFQWSDYSYANDVEIDQNGDIVVLTDFYGNSPSERINLIKLNPLGEVLWKENFAVIEDYAYVWNAYGIELSVSSNNYYYISGSADWPTNNDPNQGGGERPLFIKVNPNGNEEWVLPFGIYDNQYGIATELFQFDDQTFFSTALNWSTLNPFLIKFDENGEVISYRTKALMSDTYVSNNFIYTEIINENKFFSIWRYGYDMSEPLYNGYMVYDSSLNIIDYMEFPEIEMPCSLVKTFNNKVITVGTVKEEDKTTYYDIYLNKLNLDFSFDTVYSNWSGSYDSLCEGGVVSGYLPYTCDEVVGINEIPTSEEYNAALEKVEIKLLPNPADKLLTIALENPGDLQELEIIVFNTSGNKVVAKQIANYQTETNLNIKNWPSGVYFVVVQSKGKFVGNAKLMVE